MPISADTTSDYAIRRATLDAIPCIEHFNLAPSECRVRQAAHQYGTHGQHLCLEVGTDFITPASESRGEPWKLCTACTRKRERAGS